MVKGQGLFCGGTFNVVLLSIRWRCWITKGHLEPTKQEKKWIGRFSASTLIMSAPTYRRLLHPVMFFKVAWTKSVSDTYLGIGMEIWPFKDPLMVVNCIGAILVVRHFFFPEFSFFVYYTAFQLLVSTAS